jgi:hypothetical protein
VLASAVVIVASRRPPKWGSRCRRMRRSSSSADRRPLTAYSVFRSSAARGGRAVERHAQFHVIPQTVTRERTRVWPPSSGRTEPSLSTPHGHLRPDKVGPERPRSERVRDRLRGVAAGVAHAPHHPHLSSSRLRRRRRPPPRKTAPAVWNRPLTIELGQCPAPGGIRRKICIGASCPLARGEHCSRVCVPPFLARVFCRRADSESVLLNPPRAKATRHPRIAPAVTRIGYQGSGRLRPVGLAREFSGRAGWPIAKASAPSTMHRRYGSSQALWRPLALRSQAPSGGGGRVAGVQSSTAAINWYQASWPRVLTQ